MESTSPVRTVPGPASRKVNAPALFMETISSANRTPQVRCLERVSIILSGEESCIAAVVFENTGISG